MLETLPRSRRPHGGPDGEAAAVPGPSPRRRLLAVVLAGVFTLTWAVLCTAAVDRIQAANQAGRALERPIQLLSGVFGLSALLVWVLLLVIVAVTGRVLLSAGLLLVVSVAVGFADYQKLQMRGEPLYPSDLQFVTQPGFLADMVGRRALVGVLAACAVTVIVFLVVGRLVRRVFPPVRRAAEPRTWAAWVSARVVTFVAGVLLLAYAAHFNVGDNKVKHAYLAVGAQFVSWNQRINYERNGFLAGLLYNTEGPAMRRPADYSETTMEALAAKWSAIADRVNRHRSPTAVQDVNIVVILSESFSDPTQVEGIRLSADPIPFTRGLMRRTESGQMLSEFIGGGTANMEFEALTGLSLSQFLPQLNTPYQQLVTTTPTFPSVVGYLRRLGHDAVAIHPYKSTMYNRDEVYPTLGFSRFLAGPKQPAAPSLEGNHYVSDRDAFAQVEQQIQESGRPLFVNLVTMQNHYPVVGKYAEPIRATGQTDGLVGQLGQFARGLRYSDTAMRGFLRDLRASDERTAVVFYGDHAPPFWPRAAIYNRNEATLRKTPFFLWSNFARFPHRDLPLTSPTYFMPLLFDALRAPLPPYYVLLDRLYREVPAMAPGEYHGPDGSLIRPDELNPRARALLRDYRLVQYDLASGQRYSQASMFYPPED